MIYYTKDDIKRMRDTIIEAKKYNLKNDRSPTIEAFFNKLDLLLDKGIRNDGG